MQDDLTVLFDRAAEAFTQLAGLYNHFALTATNEDDKKFWNEQRRHLVSLRQQLPPSDSTKLRECIAAWSEENKRLQQLCQRIA